VTATVWIVCLLAINKLTCSLECIRLMTVFVSVFVCLCKVDRLYVLQLLPIIVKFSLCTLSDTHKDQSVHSAVNSCLGTPYSCCVVSDTPNSTVWNPIYCFASSNTKQYQIFVITTLQYTALTWTGPSNFRSVPSLHTVSTEPTLQIDRKYSINCSLFIYYLF
jgi:hypothetical protein